MRSTDASHLGSGPDPRSISGRSLPAAPDRGFVLPGARPLGCLLVHGFTATPDEMRPLGDALAARGFPVRGVCLAGHATTVADLGRTHWTDWFASVTDGAALLREAAGRVAVVGMSLGALLALHLAATRPAEVAGLVLCGTPLWVRDRRVRWLATLARVPWVAARYATISKAGDGPDVADPAVRAASTSYRAMPLAALLELLRLQAVVRRELARVTQPTLVLHGRHDHTAPLANVALLRRRLAARVIETHVLERSWHVVTLDYDRLEVARLAGEFLERLVADGRA